MKNLSFPGRPLVCLTGALLLGLATSAHAEQHNERRTESNRRGTQTLFQVSILDALKLGFYQGVYPIGRLREHGDFGLGTFEGIDGELTLLDGHYYHFRSDGSLTEEPDATRVPFAVVTRFRPRFRLKVADKSSADLGTYLDGFLPSPNLFYAIRIHGVFTSLTTRAIPKLFPPYPPLAEVLPQQVKFSYNNVSGTIVAFRSPAYVGSFNQAGYHYHFVSDDRTIGGHCLDFVTGMVTVEVETLGASQVWLPNTPPFLDTPVPAAK